MLKLIFGLLIAVCSIIFALQNSFQVSVRLLIWKLDVSLALLILIAFASGVLVTVLLVTPKLLKAAWQNWKIHRL